MDAPPPLDGVLVIDKPTGFTSMDVCAIVRAKLRRGGAPKRVKVGHAGTLDPLATGVLVVLAGRATRLCDRFMADEKEYEATIDLSARSATDDAQGPVEPVAVTRPPPREEIDRALASFVGRIMQTPPAYSAVKIGGRKAYEMAREGEAPPVKAREVVVHAIDVLSYTWPRLEARVRCGKGVYIRSLARDLGVVLRTGGMLTALRRTRSGAMTLKDAAALADLPPVLTQADLRPSS